MKRHSLDGTLHSKTCIRCNKSKALSEFGPYDGTVDKLDFLCRDCRATATAERERRATMFRRIVKRRAEQAAGDAG